MKKKVLLFNLTALAVSIILLSSCERDSLTSDEVTDLIAIEAGGVSFDYSQGILRFNSFEDFISTANYLNSSGLVFQYDLFKEVGFRSQEMILQEISDAEDLFDSQYYRGVDENISIQELIQTGLGIEHSPLFKYYVDQGLIAVLCEEDGSESYYPNIINPALMPVLSEQGFVIVNDMLMQFTNNQIKLTPYSSMSQIEKLENSTSADSKRNISVVDFYSDLKSIGYVTHIDNVVVKYKDSNLRVSSRYAVWDGDIDGQPLGDPALYVYINHIIELKAEEKRWGKWKIRNNYTPLCGLESSWQTCMRFGGTSVCNYTQSGAGIKNSPFNEYPFSSGCTNYYKFFPSPVGWINYSGYYYYGIESGYWSLTVHAANIDDPNNSGSHN